MSQACERLSIAAVARAVVCVLLNCVTAWVSTEHESDSTAREGTAGPRVVGLRMCMRKFFIAVGHWLLQQSSVCVNGRGAVLQPALLVVGRSHGVVCVCVCMCVFPSLLSRALLCARLELRDCLCEH